MKYFQPFLLSASLVILYSCHFSGEKTGVFKLLPQPRYFEMMGPGKLFPDEVRSCYLFSDLELPVRGEQLNEVQPVQKASEAQIICRIDPLPDLHPEGYSIDISHRKIEITGYDKAGLYYAFMTLEQLMEDATEQDIALPECSISDFPLLAYRAIHLDMKHHLEKRDYYYTLMDKLARYKVNAIIAEMEDKIKYVRQPAVGAPDALTISEWKQLSDYAMERNIEISPLIQGLGHASFILKHDQYKQLRDDPGSDWAFNPLNPGTYEVQFDLYLDAIEATPHGRYLHVGGDEVHTTGGGSGESPLELQLKWLNKVCDFAVAHGRIPIFWDDMPLKHAGVYKTMFNPELTREEVAKVWDENEYKLSEFLDQFPKNCIYMRWNYSTPQAIGNEKAMEWFLEHGMQVMGATAGQTRWVLMPQNESNMENIRSFAVTSIDKGLDGLLLTLWDDDSPHFELYMRGIIAFAEYTWSGGVRSAAEIKSAYRQREFSTTLAGPEYDFVDLLEPAVAWWNSALLKGDMRNELRTLDNPFEAGILELPSPAEKGAWSFRHAELLERAGAILKECDEVASQIASMKSRAIRNQYRLSVYEQVNNLVRFSARALLNLQRYDTAGNEQEEAKAFSRIQQMPEEFAEIRDQLEKVYGETRILDKPRETLLDQDYHHHLANQSISFDWLYIAEMMFLNKVQQLI